MPAMIRSHNLNADADRSPPIIERKHGRTSRQRHVQAQRGALPSYDVGAERRRPIDQGFRKCRPLKRNPSGLSRGGVGGWRHRWSSTVNNRRAPGAQRLRHLGCLSSGFPKVGGDLRSFKVLRGTLSAAERLSELDQTGRARRLGRPLARRPANSTVPSPVLAPRPTPQAPYAPSGTAGRWPVAGGWWLVASVW